MYRILLLSLFIIAANGSPNGRNDAVQSRKHSFGIYRGRRADIRNYPYNAAVFSHSTDSFLGNGVILNRNWILVTAYEVDGYGTSDLLVRVGTNDASSGGQTYGISKVVGHSNYTGQLYNDIALLKTSTKIIFTPTVNRLTLSYYSPSTWTSGILTGYGSSEESSDYVLRDANFTVISFDTCVSYYNFLPSTGVFCADSGTYTAADDDLGAPFVRNNMLIGTYLGSYGTYPAIFNNILPWKDWIANQIKYS